jgi:TolA-binding protein
MFRKIHSNRDPKDTLASELLKTFQPYIEKTSVVINQQMKKHPKLLYTIMLISMFISAAASFTTFRNPGPAAKKNQVSQAKLNVVTDGFDQISHTATTIGQTIRLKNKIDSLSKKQNLTQQDSLTLEKDLDQLRQLQKQQQ